MPEQERHYKEKINLISFNLQDVHVFGSYQIKISTDLKFKSRYTYRINVIYT